MALCVELFRHCQLFWFCFVLFCFYFVSAVLNDGRQERQVASFRPSINLNGARGGRKGAGS